MTKEGLGGNIFVKQILFKLEKLGQHRAWIAEGLRKRGGTAGPGMRSAVLRLLG